jgi:hypothetical protein
MLGVMRILFTDRHRNILVVLFWVFEGLLVASEAVNFCTDSPFHPEAINVAAQITCMFSLVCLFVTSFLLRRSTRYLANFGWLTITMTIFLAMAFPRL